MAVEWPAKKRLIGTKVSRIDGALKSTGRAKYSFDINRPGMLHGVILRSPHAHAKIKSIDLTKAEKMPGVKAVMLISEVDLEVYYAGDEIAALCADTEEHALDAIREIKINYEPLDFVVKEHDALAVPKRTVPGKGNNNKSPKAQTYNKGNVAEGFKTSDAVVEGEYGISVISHQCLESHGLVAEWDKDGSLKVWASTQATVGTAQQLAQRFNIPATKVNCITHFMGGGFGSKFGPDIQGFVAAELAKKAGAPVKLMLDRASEITSAGNRPSAYGKVTIGGTKDGRITAFEVSCYGTPGVRGGATVNFNLLPYIYLDEIENIRREHTVVYINGGAARAMRAPGHPQSCLLTEFAVDDLAAKLEIDPLVIRRKHLPPGDDVVAANDPTAWAGIRHKLYTEQLALITKMCDWQKSWHQPGKGPKKGPWAHGLGMAMHTWGGSAAGDNEVTVIIASDGSVTAQTSSQDLGTAQRTLNAIITAEILGLEVADITTKIGESPYGNSSGSGGSTTCPSQAPATLLAAEAAKEDLFKKVAGKLKVDATKLVIEVGKVKDSESGKTWAWKEFCAKLGMENAKGTGVWSGARANKAKGAKLSNVQVGGVQVAEVWVDLETGVVKCTNFWTVQDCGLLINKLACESQVAGGIVMGVNYALYEECILDRHTGRQVNPDMEFYKLGAIEDLPKIHVHMMDMPERGVIGIGEPPTVSTAAAVGNAIMNATGVRVPIGPFTPQRVLEAMMKGVKG
jgi:xanthine dehydrogenase YagR molybdenum-binding subunit